MNHNKTDREFLKQNERKVNDLISCFCLTFLLLCLGLVIADQTKLIAYESSVLVQLCLCFTALSAIPYFLCHHCNNDKLNKVICLACPEILLCILACNDFIRLQIFFILVPIISMLYMERGLFLRCVILCFFSMVMTKVMQYFMFSKSADIWSPFAYRSIYEEIIVLVLEYLVLSVLLYMVLVRLTEALASGYFRQQSEDAGTVQAASFDREVQEAYNTKGLFLEIEQTLQSMIRGKEKQFVCDIDYDLPVQLCGDKEQIRSALINLLSDFLQFTACGTVSLQVTYDKGILPKKGQNITVYCRVGCSEDLSDKLGAENAIGFFLAKDEIYKMNGVVMDKSDQDMEEKTCYVLSFRQHVEDQETILHAKQVHRTEQKELISDSRKRVQAAMLAREVKALVVDDSLANRKLIDAILKSYGMTTKCVSSGEEAIEQMKMKKYDFVLIDHMMPVKGGIQTAKEIRQMEDPYFEMVPLLAMTTSMTEDAQQMFYDCGFVSIVSKPIKEAELWQAISKCMFLQAGSII